MGEGTENSNNGKWRAFKEADGKKSFARTVAWVCFIWNIGCAVVFTTRILITAVTTDAGLQFGDVPEKLFEYNIYLFAATVLAYGFNKLGTKVNGK